MCQPFEVGRFFDWLAREYLLYKTALTQLCLNRLKAQTRMYSRSCCLHQISLYGLLKFLLR